MRAQASERLKVLNVEFETGQKLLAELEGKSTNIRSSLLRISGAIQVLEELLKEENVSEQGVGHCVNGAAASSANVG